jgi:Dolichyl-phosphate-mannose-protein mannosyltransferase
MEVPALRALSRGSWVVAGLLVVLLVALGGRYGFHRDELYFIEGGHHPDWAQPDNPITVPLLAAAWHDLVGGSLLGFRILPAVVAGCTVLLAAWTARLVGGARVHQTLTAGLMASTSILLATGHLFSTTTFDLAMTTATLALLIKALSAPASLPTWLVLGVAAGLAMEIKVLPALVLASCAIAILLVGDRSVFLRPGPWLAAGVALLLAAPNLIWQTTHGWPMLQIAENIAAGGSTSSQERWLVVPTHLLMAGPAAAIVLIIGLVAPFRFAALRVYRWLTVAYVIMLVLVVATGGKPYYLAGFFAAGLALGAQPLVRFLSGALWRRVTAVLLGVVLVMPTVVFALPIAPVGSPVFQVAVAVNPDQAETVGWDDWVRSVERAGRTLDPNSSVVLARNYGEAGALSRDRRLRPTSTDLPIYSGHNAYGEWGPPPEVATSAVVVGDFSTSEVEAWFAECALVERFASPPGVDNEEDGAPIRVCRKRLLPWSEIWPQVRRLG